jgi:hypothetical protein
MPSSLKDALFLGFCAVFIVAAKAALRLHLKIPGHSMLFTVFFLMMARGCVQQGLAASFAGLLAGIMSVILGMGKGGPLLIVKFLLPALVVDGMAAVLPVLFQSMPLSALTAGLAGATRLISTWVVDVLAGMDPDIVMQHILIQSSGNLVFGIAGGLLVPPVIRKLKAHGTIG